MRGWLWKAILGAAVILPALNGAASAQVTDLDGCSNATLQGDYGFSIQGQFDGIVTLEGMPPAPVLHPFASPIPINGLAMQNFHGDGTFTQVDFVMQDGIKRPGATISTGFDDNESGPYTVYPDCTGTFTIMAGPVTVTVMFVLARRGNEIHTVVKALHVPAAPPAADETTCGGGGCDLGVNIRSDGVKLGLDATNAQ